MQATKFLWFERFSFFILQFDSQKQTVRYKFHNPFSIYPWLFRIKLGTPIHYPWLVSTPIHSKLLKKSLPVFFFFVFVVMNCVGQNQGISNLWQMGYQSWYGPPGGGTDINFISGAPVITYKLRPMNLCRTFVNICDKQGNLLFYTNGDYIADSSDNPMQNGLNINPSTFADSLGLPVPQACLILQQPDSSNKYFLFQMGLDNPPNNNLSYKLYYSIIDMNLNNGKGAVIQKNFIVVNDILNPGHVTACRHANGRDWWIVCMKYNSDIIYEMLLTPTGVSGTFVHHIGLVRQIDVGQVVFSNDGMKFVYFNANYLTTGTLEIFDFDRCSGNFSNPIGINIPMSSGFGGGAAFSPNNRFLYTANIDSIYQFDMNSVNIAASKTTVAIWDNYYDTVFPFPPFPAVFDKMQLAPDGKIYISTGNSTEKLHYIEFPDSLDTACHVVQHGIQLPSLYFNSLPNHPNYFLGRDTGSVCDTITSWVGLSPNPSSKERGVTANPNPNNGQFTLWFSVHDKPGWLDVYDVNGKLILHEGVAPWSQYKQVNIGPHPDGIYFCKMQWGAIEQSVKVIKN